MPMTQAITDTPFLHRRYRNGPIDFGMNEHGLLIPGQTALIQFFDDYMDVTTAGVGVYGWIQNAVGTPAQVLTQVATGHGGVALMAPGAVANNNVHYQYGLNTTVLSPFLMALGKKTWLSVRFKIEDADQNLLYFGMHSSQTNPWGTEPNNQFAFRTVSGSPDVLRFAAGRTNTTEVSLTLNTLADDTFYRAYAFYDGVGSIQAWVTNDNATVLAQRSATLSSTQVPNGAMTPAKGNQTIDAGGDDFQLDYLYIAQER